MPSGLGQGDDPPPAFLMVGKGSFVGRDQQVLTQEAVHVFLVEALAIGGIDEFGRPHLALRAEEGQPQGTVVEGAAVGRRDGDLNKGEGTAVHGVLPRAPYAHVVPDFQVDVHLTATGQCLVPCPLHIRVRPGCRVLEGKASAIATRAAPLALLPGQGWAVHDLVVAQANHHVGALLGHQRVNEGPSTEAVVPEEEEVFGGFGMVVNQILALPAGHVDVRGG